MVALFFRKTEDSENCCGPSQSAHPASTTVKLLPVELREELPQPMLTQYTRLAGGTWCISSSIGWSHTGRESSVTSPVSISVPETQVTVCFIQSTSLRSGKSSCAWAPRDSCLFSAPHISWQA